MKRILHILTTLALVLVLSGGEVWASAAAGMLRSNGGVSVNGSPVTPVTTVFAGDRIETAPKAAGSLTIGGSSLLLDENSSMTFNGQGMDFYCGGGTVQTTQGMTARFGRVSVKPTTDSARFQVQQTGATVRISALEGNLTLTDGTKDFNLPAGNSMNMPYAGCVQNVAKNEVQSVNANAPTTNSPAPSSASTTVTHNPAWNNHMLWGPTAVAGVAIAGIIAVGQNPVSPSGP